ncbi:MAG: transglycosylase SLT domain-containing protein [Acidobacteria bacterium]|nr:transglycosylase SLT domain-containing protein [Acidobacteriota bacterium]
MKFAASLFLLLLLIDITFSQSPEELPSKIRAAVAERRYDDAINDLKALAKDQPDVFAWNNYDYLLGRMFEKSGNGASAMAQYQALVKRGSALKPYALFHLAAIARSSGNLILERVFLEELAAFSADSIVAETANNRIARSLFESGDHERALRAFEALTSGAAPPKAGATKTDNAVARENRLFLARCQMFSGNPGAAKDNFLGLIKTLANPAQPDDIALAAAKELDKIDLGTQAGEGKAPALTDYEHLQRASIYQFNRDFADARLHYAAIINNHPTSGIVPDALYQTGRGYTQETNFSEAIKWYERTVEQFPQHPSAKDALLQAASAYARVGKFRESIKRYHDYIEKYPDDERVDRAYLNIIDVLRDEGEEVEAQKWAEKVQEVFRGKLPEAQALFADVRISIARSNWASALTGLDKLLTLSDLGGAAVPGGTSKTEVNFLHAFAFEQQRRFPEAVNAYLQIPDGRAEYYGGRATDRLILLLKDETAKSAITSKFETLTNMSGSKDQDANRKNLQSALRLTDDREQREKLINSLRKLYAALPAYRKLPDFKATEAGRRELLKQKPAASAQSTHRTIADELLFLGLFDEAAPEYDASFPNIAAASGDVDNTKAVLYKRGDRAYKTVAFIEPQWRNVPPDYQVELIPGDAIELLYPAPYKDLFGKYSPPRNVDPRFLLSLIRQESRYQPDVKSYAAARGLMQFISTTSSKIASALGRADFYQDELYDPSVAILFGSQYTSDLFKLFPNQPEAVAASYNGGEDSMKRWMKRSHSDQPDRYVPEIAFSQSKDYVYRVMANYRIYKMFYDERLKPTASF